MFMGNADQSAPDTYRMSSPELNSIHVTRDVQWIKRMYVEPEKSEQIQAADSVDMIVNQAKVPLRTTPKGVQVQNQTKGPEKGPVKFDDDVELILNK